VDLIVRLSYGSGSDGCLTPFDWETRNAIGKHANLPVGLYEKTDTTFSAKVKLLVKNTNEVTTFTATDECTFAFSHIGIFPSSIMTMKQYKRSKRTKVI